MFNSCILNYYRGIYAIIVQNRTVKKRLEQILDNIWSYPLQKQIPLRPCYLLKLNCTVMEWFTNLLQAHPELAIYLTLGLGFLIGRVQVKGFSLGVVTSVLLVGVLIGQLDIRRRGR